MIQHHQHLVNHHGVHKQVQSAFNTLETGLKYYGAIKGAIELGQGIYRGAQAIYSVAAPIATAATALL